MDVPRRWIVFVIASLSLMLSGCSSLQTSRSISDPRSAASVFDQVKDSPVELHMFLQRFPKGGDLHNHLSGAIYAEDYVDWAKADGVCYDVGTMSAAGSPCNEAEGRPDLKTALDKGVISRDAIIDAWSLRNFVPGYSAPSGHDQFFQSFDRFGAAGDGRGGDKLAEVVLHAADQHIGYLELMTSPGMSAARKLAREIGPQKDMDTLYNALMEAGIESLVPAAEAVFVEMQNHKDRRLGCPQSANPACEVEVRFISQVIRVFPPEQVFAQSLLAFLLVERDPQVVGLNLVAPEDNPVTLENYESQMRQLGYLARRRGVVPVTLHAGELRPGLVHPRHLRSHIRQAIELAGAKRIGHGVSIGYERNAAQLLEYMAQQNIAVEINLTSNDQILGITGADHPFNTYRKYGVPLTLGTDDEGVSRGSLTHEYERAVRTYDLHYSDVVALSRNALSYSFLPGRSLWAHPQSYQPVSECAGHFPGISEPDKVCAEFLAGSEKAGKQWQLEKNLALFNEDPLGLKQ